MLIQMAGIFLFWWLLILGIGIAVVLMAEKFVLPSRRGRGRSKGPFATVLTQPELVLAEPQAAEPVEAPTATVPSGAAPGQSPVMLQASMPEPRRYFIGKGPAEDDRA
jgi:hypothetical protein